MREKDTETEREREREREQKGFAVGKPEGARGNKRKNEKNGKEEKRMGK